MGDLTEFSAGLANSVKKGTICLFSTEISEKEEFVVGTSERFSHADSYIETLFADSYEIYKKPCTVREEEGHPVNGTLWIVKRRT